MGILCWQGDKDMVTSNTWAWYATGFSDTGGEDAESLGGTSELPPKFGHQNRAEMGDED